MYIPLQQMRPFVPLNMMVHCKNAEYAARPKLILSVTLEMPNKESFVDELIDIIVKMVHYDPLPYASRVFLVMSQNMASIER